MKKVSKESVDYTKWGTYKEHCENCENFKYGGQLYEPSCKRVEGDIDWRGWCKLWHAKTST